MLIRSIFTQPLIFEDQFRGKFRQVQTLVNFAYKMSDTATHEAEIAAKAASPVKKVVNAEPAKDGDAAKPENGEKSSPVKNGES